MKWVRYGSEAVLILLMGMLIKMGRMTVPALLLFALLSIGLEAAKGRKHAILLSAAFILWMFNDLMAIGKFMVEDIRCAFLNFLFYAAFFLFFRGIFGDRRISCIVPEVLLLFLGAANAVLKAIRRTPLSAGDIFSVKTAMAVAGNYRMEFDREFVLKAGLGIVVVALANLIFLCCPWERGARRDRRGWLRIADAGIPVLLAAVMFGTSWIASFSGRQPDYFTHETNGFALNLYLQWKDIRIREPEGYRAEDIRELAGMYPSDAALPGRELPNIIVIMNESFSDLRVLGDFETNIEVLPVLDSLKEDTIRGNLCSSVYGGSTANSEYEFLTGGSIEYFSERVVPFQLYMNEARPSMISQAKQLGYDTVFMHPYRAYSWNRPSVYAALRTDEMMYEEDMADLEYIRSYASDASQYACIIQYLEQEKREQPLFLFDVTVQNHGGYTGTVEGLSAQVTIIGHEGEYTEAENYLTLVHESDRAFGELLEYLRGYEEPTAVLFFGDHQPAIETSFIEMAVGKPQSEFTLGDRQKMYTVPFFLWCNYDIPERQTEQMSINYLGAFLCGELGLPRTGMQKYLADLCRDMPVINTVAVSEEDGRFARKKDLSQTQAERLARYHGVIYNYMFDSAGRVEDFYTLQGYEEGALE